MANDNVIDFCPHCGNTAPQRLCGVVNSAQYSRGTENYILTQCETCQKALLYREYDPARAYVGPFLFDLDDCTRVWPSSGELHDAVPAEVKRHYSEAVLIKSRAPNAFANQIRCSLEAVCKDRGATGHTLAANLKQLADRGEIPQTLATMTDALRQLGNIGSHAGDEKVEREFVPVIDDFFAPWSSTSTLLHTK